MKTIGDLQAAHKEWLYRNFPNQKPHEPLLGLAEEVGELAHAHLKHDQGIRSFDQNRTQLEKEDAVGDIFIYLMSYCNANEINLESAVYHTWSKVRRRDWVNNPHDGGSSD